MLASIENFPGPAGAARGWSNSQASLRHLGAFHFRYPLLELAPLTWLVGNLHHVTRFQALVMATEANDDGNIDGRLQWDPSRLCKGGQLSDAPAYSVCILNQPIQNRSLFLKLSEHGRFTLAKHRIFPDQNVLHFDFPLVKQRNQWFSVGGEL